MPKTPDMQGTSENDDRMRGLWHGMITMIHVPLLCRYTARRGVGRGAESILIYIRKGLEGRSLGT